MSLPVVRASGSSTSRTTNGTTQTVAIPAYNTGDRVIVFLSVDGASEVVATPPALTAGGTFTQFLASGASSDANTVLAWYADATGNHAGENKVFTLTGGTSTSQEGTYTVYVFEVGTFDPAVAPSGTITGGTGNVTAYNCPSHTPSWDASTIDTQWGIVAGFDSATTVPTWSNNWPTNYTATELHTNPSSSASAGIASSLYNGDPNTASQDPGNVTSAISASNEMVYGTWALKGATSTNANPTPSAVSAAASIAAPTVIVPFLQSNDCTGTDTVAVTTSNSGGPDQFGDVEVSGAGASLTYSSTHTFHGNATSIHAVGGASIAYAAFEMDETTAYSRMYMNMPSNPSASARIILYADQTVFVMCTAVYVNTSGQLVVLDSGFNVIDTSTTVITGSDARLEFDFVGDAADGSFELRIYQSIESATPTETLSGSSLDTHGHATEIQYGASDFGTVGSDFYFADVEVNNSGPVGAIGGGSTDASITASPVNCSSTITTPTIDTETNIAANAVDGTTTIPSHTISVGITLAQTAIDGTTTISSPSISAGLTANAVNGTTSIPAPTFNSDAIISPSVISGTASISTPLISTGIEIAASPVDGNAAIATPAISNDQNLTEIAIDGTTDIQTPTISVGSTLALTSVDSIATIATPTVETTSEVDISANVVNGSTTIPSPGIGITINASVVNSAATIHTPTVQTSGNITIHATSVDSVTTIPEPTIAASETIAASVVSAQTNVAAPGISAGVGLGLSAVDALASISEPSVSASGNVDITATAVDASATVPSPSVMTSGSSHISASLVDASTTIPTPSISASVLITQNAIDATTSVSGQAETETRVTATAIEGTTSISQPTVSTTQTINIAPSHVGAIAIIPTPELRIGNANWKSSTGTGKDRDHVGGEITASGKTSDSETSHGTLVKSEIPTGKDNSSGGWHGN
jgi:hypothetical protein